jgi:hypothetical protein
MVVPTAKKEVPLSQILGISSSINELGITISHVVRSVTFAAHLSYTTVCMLAITRAIQDSAQAFLRGVAEALPANRGKREEKEE